MQQYQLTEIVSHDVPVIVRDAETDPRLSLPAREVLAQVKSGSFIQFPLVASGLWYGSLAVHWHGALPMSDDDIRHMQGVIDQAAAAIYNLLLRAEARARCAAEKADELLAMVSDELRTPLT